MIAPVIHSNGTSREVLEKALRDAASALRFAILKVQDTAPNGRDYYPLGNEAFQEAIGQYQSWANRLESVRNEIYAVLDEIAEECK